MMFLRLLNPFSMFPCQSHLWVLIRQRLAADRPELLHPAQISCWACWHAIKCKQECRLNISSLPWKGRRAGGPEPASSHLLRAETCFCAWGMEKKGRRLIDSLVKCDRTMEHGESECERKQNGQVNMLLFSDLGKKTDLWFHYII